MIRTLISIEVFLLRIKLRKFNYIYKKSRFGNPEAALVLEKLK